MDRDKKIAQLLDQARAGQRPVGILSNLNSPAAVEVLGHLGVEWMVFDQEHTSVNSETLAALYRTAELHDIVSMVRLESPDPILARRALDAGACGVWAQFVRDSSHLRELVEGMHFPPLGTRGYCTLPRMNAYGVGDVMSFMEFSNTHPILIAGINSETALEDLDAMLAVPECQIYAIGFVDLGVRTGAADYEQFHRAVKLAKAVARKIHDAGKLAMGPIIRPSPNVDECVAATDDVGLDMLLGSDVGCLATGYLALRDMRGRLAGVAADKPAVAQPRTDKPGNDQKGPHQRGVRLPRSSC